MALSARGYRVTAVALGLSFVGLPLGLDLTRTAIVGELACQAEQRDCARWAVFAWAGPLLALAGVFALSFLLCAILAMPFLGVVESLRERKRIGGARVDRADADRVDPRIAA